MIGQEALAEYIIYLKIERGLSANTVTSYKRDIEKYLTFLMEKKITQLDEVSRFEILDFLQTLRQSGQLITQLFGWSVACVSFINT